MIEKAYKSLVESSKRTLRTDDSDRLIDFGIEIIVVAKDVEFGSVPKNTGLPPLIEVRKSLRLGGKFDTLTRQFVGECDEYRCWLIGEKQFDILFSENSSQHNLLYSAEGAGKTVLMAQWIWVQIFAAAASGITGTVGATAPTAPRLGTLIKAVRDLGPISGTRDVTPSAWATEYVDAREIRVCSGHLIQFRSTKKQSGATGSPVQGWTWNLGAAMDEAQDSVEQGVYADVIARLRGGERSPVMATATAKDSPIWRAWRDKLSENWTIHRLKYTDTPFVHDSHWDMMRKECSEREWRRRGEAEDVGPEKMTYLTWDRKKHLIPVPFGAEDVTQTVLSQWGGNFGMLIGHDPGNIYNVSVLLKAYRIPGIQGYSWFIVDDVTTKRTTTEEHTVKLLHRLRSKWKTDLLNRNGRPGNGVKSLTRADPYSNSGNDKNQPDKSVYLVMRGLGLTVMPAAYSKVSIKEVKPGKIPKEAGIEMIIRLLSNADGVTRLYMATEDGVVCAPDVVRAFEMSERDGDGNAETQKKTTSDLSHWMAAIRYALWAIEKPRIGGMQ